MNVEARVLLSKMVDRPHDYLSDLRKRIAIARNELGMSQDKMSAALGISLRAYQSYELSKSSIPVKALVELHRQFAVDLNWILLGVEALRLKHNPTALEKFEVGLDKHLSASGIKVRKKKLRGDCHALVSLVSERKGNFHERCPPLD